jgi:hypothetical protein
MYKSLFEYVTYAPTKATAMIPEDIHTKVISSLDSLSRIAGSKYLNGEKYFKKSRFSFKPEMMERKYVPSNNDTAIDTALLYCVIAHPRNIPTARNIICMIKRANKHKDRKL